MIKKILLLFLGSVLLTTMLYAQQEVTGTVTDEVGDPIVGASIAIKGTTEAVITNLDGSFKIEIIEDEAILVIRFIGMKIEERQVSKGQNINVQLIPADENIEEVVVTAFGTKQKKVSMVGAVQTVRPSELEVPSANLSSGFAGRLSGVIAVQRSGEPGADGADFWIRGIASVNASNPLIVLDGVEISSGDLNAIDPEIIEGFTILKDATATSLYGSRGANGVVIVATKNGKNLKNPVINFSIENNMNMPTSIPEFVDGARYMELFNEAIGNLSTGDAPYSKNRIEGTRNHLNPYVYPDVNWYEELFRETALSQKVNFNIRGGGKKLDYFMSVTANHQAGMLKDRSSEMMSYNNQLDVYRYTFQNNIRTHFSETSSLSLRLNAQVGRNKGPDMKVEDIFKSTMSANPVDFPIMFPKDEFADYTRWGTIGGGPSADFNPFAKAVSSYKSNFNSTLLASLEFNQDLKMILDGLSFKALASFKNWTSTSIIRMQDRNYFELASFDPNTYELELARQGDEKSTTLFSMGENQGDRKMYFQAMFLYNKTFDVYTLNAMLNYYQEEFAVNLASRNILNNLPKRRQGIAGRMSFSYLNRYMIEINFGYNGSENFAEGHRFGLFPSMAFGVNLSEETFWTPIKPYISVCKIRASYGLVGNDNIVSNNKEKRFVYLGNVNLYDGNRSYVTGKNQDYTNRGPSIKRFDNTDITWEVGYKGNVGLDLEFFKSLRLSVDLFREERRDVFIQRGVVPTYMGTAGTELWGNLAKIENKGIDASLDYGKKISKDFMITARGTFTFTRNEVIEWDEPAFMEYPQLSRIGHRLNMHQGYNAERLFIDKADIDNSASQTGLASSIGAGDIKYTDVANVNGIKDGQINENDKQYIGNPLVPEMIYGFGVSMQYKAFDFSVFFQGAGNTSLMISGFHPFGTQYNRNVLKFIADDYWSSTNQNIDAAYPRLTKLDHRNNTVGSSYWLRDASFLKFKNVELGYTFKNVRIYLRGQNLFTFSKFKLWDPEMGGGNGLKYPTQRTYSVGLRMTIR